MQGIYNNINNNKQKPLNTGIISVILTLPSNISSVETMLSLAVNPVIILAVTRQSVTPIGLKIGVINLAILAKILSSLLVT